MSVASSPVSRLTTTMRMFSNRRWTSTASIFSPASRRPAANRTLRCFSRAALISCAGFRETAAEETTMAQTMQTAVAKRIV